MIFVDTNYFLRFLLSDNLVHNAEAKQLILEASLGKINVFTSTIVIFEIYWVLTKVYEKSENETLEAINGILNFAFLKIDEREILLKAIKQCKAGKLGLEDSYNLIYAKHKKALDFKTFDVKLSKAFRR